VAAASTCWCTVALLVAVVVADGTDSSWLAAVSSLALSAAGLGAAVAVPAVLSLVLRARHPVASGLLATLLGGAIALAAGTGGLGSEAALVCALVGVGLVVSSVPLPAEDRPGWGAAA
jgi:hypothetical protein